MDELVKYLRALVYLQLQSIAGQGAFQKPEFLLSQSGFKVKEIAEILGKKEAAVSKTINRARKAQKEANDGD